MLMFVHKSKKRYMFVIVW